MPFFSVVIPTYNRASMIGQALGSVFAQRFRDYEVIVVDDGSTDDTRRIVENGFSRRVRYVRQPNAGAGAARNAGIECARGAYVVFLDSDDLWFPWTLQTYRDVIDRNGQPAIVMGAALYWHGDASISAVRESSLEVRAYPDYLATASDRFVRTACVLAIDRERLRAVGGFTTARINGEDYDLLYRMGLERGFARIVSPPVVAYRQHDASSCSDPRRSFDGTIYQLDREARGAYPGGEARRAERSQMILFGARNVSWMLLETRNVRDACTLYRRSLKGNLAERRARYLLAFPALAAVAAAGLYKRARARALIRPQAHTARSETPVPRYGQAGDTSPLRILLVVHHNLDWNAGAAGSTLHLKREYEAAGHRVDLFSFDDLPARCGELAKQILFPWAVARYLNRCADRYDVIDATTGDTWVWATARRGRVRPALVTRSTGLEHIAHLARVESTRAGDATLSWKYPIYHGGARLREVAESLRLADACMFLNEDDRQFAIRYLRVRPACAMLVANGVPRSLLNVAVNFERAPNDPIGIACLGSFIARKGIDYLVPALHMLLRERSNLSVSFIGAGVPEEIVLRRFDPAMHARVRVVQRYDHRELPQHFRPLQIQVMASLTEGFGKTLIEGMCCGLATVTTDVAFTRDVIRHGANGLIVPIRDAGAIARAVSTLCEDAALMQRIRRNGHATAQDYSWAGAARGRLEGYRRAIAKRAMYDPR